MKHNQTNRAGMAIKSVLAGLLLAVSGPGFAQSCPTAPEPMDILLFMDNSGSITNAEFDAAQQAVAGIATAILSPAGTNYRPGSRLAVVNWACQEAGSTGSSRDGCRIDLATATPAGGWSTNAADFAYAGSNSSSNRVCRSFGNIGSGVFMHRNNCGGANFTTQVSSDYAQHALKVLEGALYSGGGTGGVDSNGAATVRPGAPRTTARLMLIHMTDASASGGSLIREVPLAEASLGYYYYSNSFKNVRNALVVGVGIDSTNTLTTAANHLGGLSSRGGSSTRYDSAHSAPTLSPSTQTFDMGAPRLATFSATYNAAQILAATTAALEASVPACVILRKQTVGGTGTFNFTGGTNGLPSSLALTTTAVNTPVSSPAYILPNFNTATGIQETIPSGWTMTGAACVNAANASVPVTVNTTTGQVTIPAAQITAGVQLTCTVTNTRASTDADLWITKTNTPAQGPSDLPDDTVLAGTQTTYDIVLGNTGPASVTNAILTDTPSTGLTNCVLAAPACAVVSGTATCPTEGSGAGQLSMANLTGGGVLVPLLQSNSSMRVRITCTVQ